MDAATATPPGSATGHTTMYHVHTGEGLPLVLIHGLGGNHRSWDTILPALAAEREVIAVDLPGFGATPELAGEASIAALADAIEAFLAEHELEGADLVGSSMGARLVLELARRGTGGAIVALSPGGFWSPAERRIFGASIWASVRLVRALQPLMPALTASAAGRTALFAQLSARPWRLPPDVLLREMRSFAASPAFDSALSELVNGPAQEGAAPGAASGPITIGWGRRDLVCPPRQASTALERFPDARLHWFDHCGHFPHWDRPEEAVGMILGQTGQQPGA